MTLGCLRLHQRSSIFWRRATQVILNGEIHCGKMGHKPPSRTATCIVICFMRVQNWTSDCRDRLQASTAKAGLKIHAHAPWSTSCKKKEEPFSDFQWIFFGFDLSLISPVIILHMFVLCRYHINAGIQPLLLPGHFIFAKMAAEWPELPKSALVALTTCQLCSSEIKT